jgi:hypothetical protein
MNADCGLSPELASAAQVELELDAGDGYKSRVSWLAQAAVSGCLFC